jgi:predicted N-formylglutamate amidohydrolase
MTEQSPRVPAGKPYTVSRNRPYGGPTEEAYRIAAATIRDLKAQLESRDQRIKELEGVLVWAKRASRVIQDLESSVRDWDYDESAALMDWPEAMDVPL